MLPERALRQRAQSVNPTKFVTELKRRNVYRAAVAYGVVAWFLTQLTTQTFPFFEIPNSAVRFVVIALAVGFPIAMLLSWLYELTPEGIVRTEDLDPVQARSVQRASGRILDFIIIGVLLLAIAMLIVGRRPFYRQTGEAMFQKSIAVLPFENLSPDPDNAFFAEGIQEEILTRLASIADLRVISRSSTQHYQNKPRNLAQIAKQLGVANILEGSVQKAADQVRVNVQLVNAQTDSHLWAETYDRKLTDIFEVESEIAKGIAASLQAKLTGREEQALAVKPTNNPEAYDVYLRGRAFQGRHPFALAEKAIGYYEQAVQLDPNFALAWAWLSRANASVYFTSGGKNVARHDAVKKALENAERLQPNLPETRLALGYYQFQVLGDYGLAKTTFRLVSKMLPGSSEVPYALGLIAENEGNWNESVAYFEQGLTLDPRNVELLKQAAFTYAWLREFPTALKLYDRALDIIPNDPETMAFKAAVYQAQGNLEQAAKLLSEKNAQHPSENDSAGASVTVLRQLRLERNHAELVRLLQTQLAQFDFDSEFAKGFAQVNLAFAQYFGGDSAGAKLTAEQARNTLEPLCKSQPNNAMFARLLSLSYAALGNKDSAINEAERAIMLSQSARDRHEGSRAEENLAVIQAMFGENNQAISTLTRLLQTPYGSSLCNPMPLTLAFLRLDPFWDPLRSDPAFQKLCEEKQP
jgi:TolB-like protein/Flp pilus assembly protein TadD